VARPSARRRGTRDSSTHGSGVARGIAVALGRSTSRWWRWRTLLERAGAGRRPGSGCNWLPHAVGHQRGDEGGGCPTTFQPSTQGRGPPAWTTPPRALGDGRDHAHEAGTPVCGKTSCPKQPKGSAFPARPNSSCYAAQGPSGPRGVAPPSSTRGVAGARNASPTHPGCDGLCLAGVGGDRGEKDEKVPGSSCGGALSDSLRPAALTDIP